MNNDVLAKLCELIGQYGTALCDDPRLVEALLRDYCGEYKREINVLITAMRENIPEDLLSSNSSAINAKIVRLRQRLVKYSALTDKAADWAVTSWAIALGIVKNDLIYRSEEILDGIKRSSLEEKLNFKKPLQKNFLTTMPSINSSNICQNTMDSNHIEQKLFEALERCDLNTFLSYLDIEPHLINYNFKGGGWGGTFLHFAYHLNCETIAMALIEKGADIHARDERGNTPLHLAAGGFKKTVEMLIDNGADINARDHDGSTPLYKTANHAAKGYLSEAKLLISNGADVNARTKGGSTPLGVALMARHNELIDFFRRHNAVE